MSVTYQMSLDDVIALQLHLYDRKERKRHRRQMILVWWIVGSVSTSLVYLRRGQIDGPWWEALLLSFFLLSFFSFFLLVLPGLVLLPVVGRRLLKTQLHAAHRQGRLPLLKTPIEMSISHSGLACKTESSHSDEKWIVVKHVEPVQDFFHLEYVSGESRIVPRRAFATQDEFDAFCRLASQYHQDALSSAEQVDASEQQP